MNVAVGELKSIGSTTATAITATNTDDKSLGAGYMTFFIKVVTGTIKLGIGGVPTSAQGFTSSDTVPPVTCRNGELFLKQAANTDNFVITTA